MLNKWFLLSFFWQLAFFILTATILNYLLDERSGYSALLGGLAYCLPTLLANIYMHKPSNDDERMVVGRAYISNVYKLIMTAGILVFVFKEVDIRAGVFIACYCLAAVVQFVTSFVSINRE
jgi:F0F1-type ATP synthase assembly protein I